MPQEFSSAAYEWLRNYHGKVDSLALLMAFDAGVASDRDDTGPYPGY